MNTPVVKNPNLREIKYQTIIIDVNAAAPANGHSDFGGDYETDKQYERVVGVSFEILPSAAGVNSDLLRIRQFEIQGREVYPDQLPVKSILCSNDVSPNKRFDENINEEAKGSKVKISLGEYNSGAFVAYKVAVILKLSNKVTDVVKSPDTTASPK